MKVQVLPTFCSQIFQRLEEVKNKSRVFSDYDNSLLVRLLVPFQPRKIRNYQVGNGSLTGNNSGRTIGENHYLSEGLQVTILPTIFHENRREE